MEKKNTKPNRNQINHSLDNQITDHIHQKIHEKMLESAMDITANVKDGYVYLSGIVDLYSEKKLAEEIAIHTEGVKGIENKITVAMDSNITDKHIQKEVEDRLLNHKNDHINGVGVKVTDGVVKLIGNVPSLFDSNRAMEVASTARGVKNVVSNMTIEGAGKYTDTDISNRILQKLSETPLSYPDINRVVDGGIVTLSGYLNNEKEVELATEIAMSVEGVQKVKNHIKTRN